MGRAPLEDEILRIEMRLLSETKSVLEYLCQYFLIVKSLDIKVQQIVLQFPQDRNTVVKNSDEFAGQTVTDEANQNLRAGVVELVLMNGIDSSQQRDELQLKSRTENIATISNPMIPFVAESVLNDG